MIRLKSQIICSFSAFHRSHLYSSLIGKPGAAAAQQKGRPAGPGGENGRPGAARGSCPPLTLEIVVTLINARGTLIPEYMSAIIRYRVSGHSLQGFRLYLKAKVVIDK